MPDSYRYETDEMTQAIESTQEAIEELNRTAERIERAVKDSHSAFSTAGWVVLGYFLFAILPGEVWHSKWRYSIQYSVESQKVQVDKEPHDCDFLAAPLGTKYCDYDIQVSVEKWATSTTGQPITSLDDGKSWRTFTPDAGMNVPPTPTVERVYVHWVKRDF